MKTSRRLRLILGIIFLVALAGLFFWSPFGGFFKLDAMIQWVEGARRHPGAGWVFYPVFALAIMVLPITPFPIMGGVLFPFWVALPLNLLASLAGAAGSFLVARFTGRGSIDVLLRARYGALEPFLDIHTARAVALIRFVGVPPYIAANYCLGFSRVSLGRYLIGTAFGIFPWLAMVTWAASALWQALVDGGHKGLSAAMLHHMAPLMVLSVVTLAMVLVSAWRRRAAARQSADQSKR